jgi:uncharacterized protein (TIGR03083 family)
MDREQVWRQIAAQRRELADLLAGLSPEQWERPSLCAGWRVRDVAAHLTSGPTTGLVAGAVQFVRAGGDFDRMVAEGARRGAARPVGVLVDELRAVADSRRLPPVTNHLNALLDVLVHGQDITVPLDIERPVPAGAGRVAADRVWVMGWPFRARRRLSGLRVVATDADWTRGAGPVLAGPVGALLLVMTGRPAGLARLSGPGADLLAGRFARA